MTSFVAGSSDKEFSACKFAEMAKFGKMYSKKMKKQHATNQDRCCSWGGGHGRIFRRPVFRRGGVLGKVSGQGPPSGNSGMLSDFSRYDHLIFFINNYKWMFSSNAKANQHVQLFQTVRVGFVFLKVITC